MRLVIRLCLVEETDFLQALHVPLPRDQSISFMGTADGFPAFDIRPTADIRMPVESLYMLSANFSVHAVFMPKRPVGGFLFAIVGPTSPQHVQFGLAVRSSQTKSTVFLYYATVQDGSDALAEFDVEPPLTDRWTKLVVKVRDNQVSLMINCKQPAHSTQTVTPNMAIAGGLKFENGSTLFVAQAGPDIADDNFEVFRTTDIYTIRNVLALTQV